VLSIDEADHHNRAYSLEQGIGMSPDLHLPLHVGHSRTVTGLEPVDKMRVAGGRNRWRNAHAVETKTEGLGLEMLRQLGGGHGHTDSGSQSGFEFPRVLDSEVLIDLTRRVGAIESVEMDSPNRVAQRVAPWLVAQMTSYPATAGGSSPQRSMARWSRPGIRAPSASSAIRTMFSLEVIGMIPARIGTLMPASSQRSRKS